jgi:dipeptidyl aminopeptidase/acylaminoacyl peptidase
MMFNRRQASAVAAALLTTAVRPTAAQGAATPVPLEVFFREPVMSRAVLSPAGAQVALLNGAKDARVRLAVLRLDTMKVQVVASFSDADVGRFQWVNENRLAFTLEDRLTAPADRRFAFGLFAVNADGEGFRQLAMRENVFVKDSIGTRQLPWNTFMLGQSGTQTGDDVFVVQPEAYSDKGLDFFKLLRLNTVTGRSEEISTPVNAFNWLFDAKGALSLVVTEKDNRSAIHLRDPQTGEWRQLRQFERFQASDVTPLWIAPDGQVYATTLVGRDTLAVTTYNPAKDQAADKPVLATPEFDIQPQFIASDERLLGVRYTTDAEVTHWFDETLKAHQAEVDRLLPSTANLLTPPRRGTSPHIVVRAFSDRQPVQFLLYHSGTKKLSRLGSAHPEIRPAQMGISDFVRIKARDGLEIPAYLTLPPGEKKTGLPLVVLVHGGPWGRGASWGWDPEVQFLASRGYAVLQPEFRGGTGFGQKHFRAGFKQWGQAMQDDLADAARWAVAQGVADAKRVAIAGASYGGYAALMGLVKDPDVFRCAVNWVGVSDLNLLYSASWDDISPEFKRWGMPAMLGDREKDAAMLRDNSPLTHAARIKNPLLMAYGGDDRRVPIEHGKRLYDAVKGHNPNVEWVVYDKEGHGWALPETRVDFWGRVERFLAKHLAA